MFGILRVSHGSDVCKPFSKPAGNIAFDPRHSRRRHTALLGYFTMRETRPGGSHQAMHNDHSLERSLGQLRHRFSNCLRCLLKIVRRGNELSDAQASAYVEMLERRHDQIAERTMPSGDDLAAELEEFLRGQDNDD